MRAQEASRRALLAVARLTIIAGAAGCAGNVVVEKEQVPDDADTGDADPNDVPDVAIDLPATACFEGATDEAACCSDLLTKTFSDEHLFTDPALATDEEKACCDLAVATLDTWQSPEPPPFDWAHASNCCGTGLVEGGWEAHPSCTPWGPPMPPAMPSGFDLEVLA